MKKLKENKNWFKWDNNSRHDQKIQKLIMKEGMCGYGIFVALCETLHENDGLIVDLDIISYDLRIDNETLIRILDSYELFLKDERGYYYNERVNEQLKERKLKSDLAKESIKRRWNKEPKIEEIENFL